MQAKFKTNVRAEVDFVIGSPWFISYIYVSYTVFVFIVIMFVFIIVTVW